MSWMTKNDHPSKFNNERSKKPIINKIKNLIKEYMPLVTLAITLLLLLSSRGCFHKAAPEGNTQVPQKNSLNTTTTTSLEAAQKANPQDPDLVITQKYTAVINGEKVEAQVKPVVNPKGTGTTATVTQEIDITNLVKKAQPNWELGVGVGYHKDLYIPISLQRNYAPKKAIAGEVHLDASTAKPTGYEIQHTWFF